MIYILYAAISFFAMTEKSPLRAIGWLLVFITVALANGDLR
jgi:hypothetical protein